MWQEDFIKKGMVIIDRKTGVNYIVIERGQAVTVVPRLNADGTLYVSNLEELDN